MGTIIEFPGELVQPPRVSTREIARLAVAEWRTQKAATVSDFANDRNSRFSPDAKPLILQATTTKSPYNSPGKQSPFSETQPENALQVNSEPRRGTVATDAAGNPSESRCSASHLANILAVRDEWEARKLVASRGKQLEGRQ